MKKASDLIASRLESRDALKRQSTAIKRLAGGLSSQLRSDFLGLSTSELRTLRDAAGLLNEMAGVLAAAAKLAEARERLEARRLAEVRKAMSTTFAALKSPAERVQFIAAAYSRALERVATLDDLDFHFAEEINSLAYRLATRGDVNRSPNDLVAEMWQKFVSGRDELAVKHAGLIKRLEVQLSKI